MSDERLTDEQIDKARALRAEGKSYPDIALEVGWKGSVDTIRSYCTDVAVPNMRAREDKPVRERADGKGTIRTYSEVEDGLLIAWTKDPEQQARESLYALGQKMDRQRHSLAARIKTLQRKGRIPAAFKVPDGRRKTAEG